MSRADFGPISEMCGIWMNYDIRSDFYIKKLKKINKRKKVLNMIECAKKHMSKDNEKIMLPFQCDSCEYFYPGGNFILPSIFCSTCKKNICLQCRIEMESGINIFEEMNIEKIQDLEGLITDQPIQSEKEIPEEGLIIDLKSMQRKIVHFTKI